MKHFILSVDEINKLQMENEAYKQSEQEAKEIIAELKAENEALIEGLGVANKYVNKYHQTLQEIKEIAEEWMKDYCYLDNFKDKEGCCICHKNKDCYSYRLLKTLTKAESEG